MQPTTRGTAAVTRASEVAEIRVLRLRGGKGGLRNQLRGEARKGKTSHNLDAARSLDGTRIRHLNAAADLARWYARAPEREAARVAKEHADPLVRAPEPPPAFDEDAHDQKLCAARDAVSAAVSAAPRPPAAAATSSQATSSVTGQRPAKRGAEEPQPTAQRAKRLWADPLDELSDGTDSESAEEAASAPSGRTKRAHD